MVQLLNFANVCNSFHKVKWYGDEMEISASVLNKGLNKASLQTLGVDPAENELRKRSWNIEHWSKQGFVTQCGGLAVLVHVGARGFHKARSPASLPGQHHPGGLQGAARRPLWRRPRPEAGDGDALLQDRSPGSSCGVGTAQARGRWCRRAALCALPGVIRAVDARENVVQDPLSVVGRQPNLRISDGSLSAVFTPIFAIKYSSESSWRDLQYVHTFAPLRPFFPAKIVNMFVEKSQNLLSQFSVKFVVFLADVLLTFLRNFTKFCRTWFNMPNSLEFLSICLKVLIN